MAIRRSRYVLAAWAAFACQFPAFADVKDGVDAWGRGDWDAAIAEWRVPAQQGDADAMFNLAQAYRLGRGVPQDQATAESYYLRAAQAGHLRAADTYGLLLFQDGRREAALPYVQGAAERGDPRAQYLLGIAHFNGDITEKDWVRAYALVTLANGQGLPQAAPALAEMDKHIPLEQRQQAASLAVQLQQQADATRAREMANSDLSIDSAQGSAATASAPASQPFTPAPAPVPSAQAQTATPRVPQPVATVPVVASSTGVPQSVPTASAAVREATQATGTESPGQAGADFARPAASQAVASAPVRTAQPAPTPVAARPVPAPVVQSAPASGEWQLQLGAFSVRANAERLMASIETRPDLAGRTASLVQSGRLTRVLVGGYASRGAAEAACAGLERSGQACIVTR